MNSQEHAAEAERLIALADTANIVKNMSAQKYVISVAQVHATLAVAKACAQGAVSANAGPR